MKWTVRTNDFKSADIQGLIIVPQKKDLVQVGLKKLGLFWLCALICLPFPGLHFVLVPLFFILGLVSFFKSKNIEAHLQNGHYLCPECQSRFDLKNLFFNGGDKLRCSVCAAQLKIILSHENE